MLGGLSALPQACLAASGYAALTTQRQGGAPAQGRILARLDDRDL